jgi:hypothetical protein
MLRLLVPQVSRILVNEGVIYRGVRQAFHDMVVDGHENASKDYEPRRLPFPAPADLVLNVSHVHLRNSLGNTYTLILRAICEIF